MENFRSSYIIIYRHTHLKKFLSTPTKEKPKKEKLKKLREKIKLMKYKKDTLIKIIITIAFLVLTLIVSFDINWYQIDLFVLTILTLAVFRLTRLLTNDIITQSIRDYFQRKKEKSVLLDNISTLINCLWCSGMWSTLVIMYLFAYFGKFGEVLILILAITAVASYLHVISNILVRISEEKKQD